MKVYIAKDWTGSHVFAEPPVLIKCGGMPDIWSGHELKEFSCSTEYIDNDVPRNKYIEGNIFCSMINLKNIKWKIIFM